MKQKTDDDTTYMFKIGALGAAIFIALIAVFSTIYKVDEGNRGILLTWGKASEEAITPGIHIKTPFVQKIKRMDVRTVKIQTSENSASKDLQDVQTDIALNYHLNPAEVVNVYRNVGINYEERIIRPAIAESVRSATALFTAEELIQKRPEVRENIRNQLIEKLRNFGFEIDAFNIVNFQFSEEFDKAIEAKVTAEQEALKAERELQRIKVEKEQTITRAEAEAQSKKNIADAEAYALRVVRQELEQSNDLIQKLAIDKWNGQVPMISGTGIVPFVNLDLEQNASR